MLQIRKALSSRKAVLVFRIFFFVIALGLVIQAIKTAQALSKYDAEFGSLFWFVCLLKITSPIVGVLCIWMMGRNWAWAVWVWAVSALGIASIGVLIGFNVRSLAQWDVVVPWIVLLVSGILKSQTEKPKIATWQRAFVTLLLVYVCMAGFWFDVLSDMVRFGNVAGLGSLLIIGFIASLIGLAASPVLVSFLGIGILTSRYGFVFASVLLSLIAHFVFLRILMSISMVE